MQANKDSYLQYEETVKERFESNVYDAENSSLLTFRSSNILQSCKEVEK